jgi:putative aminopeptidase FrvX
VQIGFAAVPTPELLHNLLTAAGPSGYETAPARVWRDAAKAFADVSGDPLGSSIARVAGTKDGPRLAIVGHIDEIGLIVTHIDDDGFLWITGVGGWDPQILVGQRVDVITKDGPIPGVVGKKPIHLLEPEERKKVAELKDLHIDIGAKDGDEARSMLRVGDVAVISGEPVELPNDRVFSRSMDNRLGAFVALEAARLVAESGGAPGEVVAVAAVQEEITFAGSRTTAFSVDPDVAIAVDVTFATDAPGIDVKARGKHELGSGPVVARGSTIAPAVFEGLAAAADEAGIEVTFEASAGRTGTDADAIHLSRAGIPTGVVSIPLRYMHSPVEMVQLSDVTAAAKLIAAFAQRLEPGMSFVR